LISDTAGIEVQGANEVTILLVAGTSFLNDHRKDFKGEHPHQLWKKDWLKLPQNHIINSEKDMYTIIRNCLTAFI
jgi:hypothetical protein